MALDTRQKRMSAMNLACPWRGPLVNAPDPGFTQGNRQAADFMYSGILASGFISHSTGPDKHFLGEIQSIGDGSILDASMGSN